MDCNLRTFLTNDSSSDESDNFQQIFLEKDNRKNVVAEAIENVVHLQIKNRLSYKATSNIIKLMNKNSTAAIKLPENTATIKQYNRNENDYIFSIKCEKCNEMVMANTKCERCKCVLSINSKKKIFRLFSV